MIAGSYPKHSAEVVPLGADFVRYLIRDNDTIANFSNVTAKNVDTGLDSHGEIFEGTPILGPSLILKDGVPIMENSRVIQRVKGGVPGQRHLVEYVVNTALGNRWEGGIYLVITQP